MKINLDSLAIEVTRRCNLKCPHCMRGPSQNIDMTKETMYAALHMFDSVDHICFSGGEPLLNPDLIIYALDIIIEEELDVHNVSITTNGQIFSKPLVDALNRFNRYRNIKYREKYSDSEINELLNKGFHKVENVRITFSTDKYHKEVSEEVRDDYKRYLDPDVKITDYAVRDESLLKTGFSQIGKQFDYSKQKISYYQRDNSLNVLEMPYITVKGYIAPSGDGSYDDIDKSNMGHISETSFEEALYKYGEEVFKQYNDSNINKSSKK